MSANLFDPDYDQLREEPGFRARRAFLGRQVGARSLGVSLFEVEPGETAYPYHYHLGEEEIVIVLEGTPSLRSSDGWRELAEGEVLCFPTGEEGAHQLANWSEETVRFLAISPAGAPDLILYPDSDKLMASERVPEGGGLRGIFRMGDGVDYHEGETPPARPG